MNFIKRFSFFLSASVFQGVLAILILPLTTQILGPAEYGIFALVLSVTAIGTVVSSLGSNYIFSAHYPLLEERERSRMISTMIWCAFFLALLFSFIVVGGRDLMISLWPAFADIPLSALMVALAAMVFGLPWIFAIDIITLEGRAVFYSGVVMTQSFVSALVTLASLFWLNAGVMALFWGLLAGSAVLFFGTAIAMRSSVRFLFDIAWVRKIWKIWLVAVPASLLETLHNFFERSLLSLTIGFVPLGVYTHSQQYKSMAMMGVKAAARTAWPITLEEARAPELEFPKTREVWDVLYVGLTAAGLFFAAFGRTLIALLTNGKFADASLFVTIWMVFLLVQHAGKPHTGFLLAHNKGAVYARMQIFSTLISIALLFLLIPPLGLFGAVLSIFAQMLIFRIWIQVRVAREVSLPFQDRWVIFGAIFILAALGIEEFFTSSFLQNVVLFVAAISLLAGFANRIVASAFNKVKISF